MKPGLILASLFVVILAGCGTSSDGDKWVSISGTISDRSFNSKSGAFDVIGDTLLLLAVTDQADICGLAGSGELPSDLQWLSVSLCIEAGSEVGQYQIEEGNPYVPCEGKIAWAEIRQFLNGTPSVVSASEGTVTLDAFSSNSISGTLQANFTDEGSVTGDFEVELCHDLNK